MATVFLSAVANVEQQVAALLELLLIVDEQQNNMEDGAEITSYETKPDHRNWARDTRTRTRSQNFCLLINGWINLSLISFQ